MPTTDPTASIFGALAAPIPRESVKWRREGSIERYGNGKFYARYVPYVDQNVVRNRLDEVAPGWSFTMNEQPEAALVAARRKDAPPETVYAVTGELTLPGDYGGVEAASFRPGVTRAGVGEGRSPKAAATDAFKRAALAFGVAHELWDMPPVMVEMTGPGRDAKPKYDPWSSVDRFKGNPFAFDDGPEPKAGQPYVDAKQPPITTGAPPSFDDEVPACEACGGPMYDNRRDKATGRVKPSYPDFKCKDRSCGKAVWIDKRKPQPSAEVPVSNGAPPSQLDAEDDDLPF